MDSMGNGWRGKDDLELTAEDIQQMLSEGEPVELVSAIDDVEPRWHADAGVTIPRVSSVVIKHSQVTREVGVRVKS